MLVRYVATHAAFLHCLVILSDLDISRKPELFRVINGQPACKVLTKPNVRPRIRRIIDQRPQCAVQLRELPRRLLGIEMDQDPIRDEHLPDSMQ